MQFRMLACLMMLAMTTASSGDVLKPGRAFPLIEFLNSDESGLKSYEPFLGKKSVVFVYASW